MELCCCVYCSRNLFVPFYSGGWWTGVSSFIIRKLTVFRRLCSVLSSDILQTPILSCLLLESERPGPHVFDKLGAARALGARICPLEFQSSDRIHGALDVLQTSLYPRGPGCLERGCAFGISDAWRLRVPRGVLCG